MDQETVISTLRALLLSAKGGVKQQSLNAEFKAMIGERIPYQTFGFPSLDAFLRSIPGIKISNKGGEFYVEAIPTEDTRHLSKLISKQKSTKKRKKLTYSHKNPTRRPNYPRMATRSYSYRSVVDDYRNTMNSYGTQKVSNVGNAPRSTTIERPHSNINSIPPLMNLQIKTTFTNNERPRFVEAVPYSLSSSPSKRLKERQRNIEQQDSSQSINKSVNNGHMKSPEVDKPVLPVITMQPKTVKPLLELHKPKSNISERLKQPQSEVLSPLSPRQLLTGNNNIYTSCFNEPHLLKGNDKITTAKIEAQDPVSELSMRAKLLNLGEPDYMIVSDKMKNVAGRPMYARVKVGSETFTSYPNEAETSDKAKKLVAAIALHSLIMRYNSASVMPETKDLDLIKERIMAIIDRHPNGVFMHQVPMYYQEQFNESLPDNWLKTVNEHPLITEEEGAHNSTILQRRKETQKPTTSETEKVETSHLSPIGLQAPSRLQPPEDPFWMVNVNWARNTANIWVRLIGEEYSEELDLMTAEMIKHYGKDQSSAKIVEVGGYYAVFEDDCWHRVQCIKYDTENEMATVFFIDHGDKDNYQRNRLYPLDRKFYTLSAQAQKICLSGLEDFDECESIVAYIEELLVGQSFYVEVVNYDANQGDEPVATVVFFDTRGTDDININNVLLQRIMDNVITSPKLNALGITEVFVSHIEETGNIYVQMQTESMICLMKMLNRLTHAGLNAESLKDSVVAAIDTSKLYLVSQDGNWYRGKVTHICSNNEVKMRLIDFGNTVTVKKESLLLLEKLSDTLKKYPSQALRVKLYNINNVSLNSKMIDKLTELAPPSEPLLAKLISKGDAPCVELFKRIKPTNMLVSINSTLVYEKELMKTQDGNNNLKPKKQITPVSKSGETKDPPKSLKPPKIANIGEYFDVHITMAANPGNFTIQPYDSKQALTSLMMKLQEICEAYTGPPPNPESVKPGKIYAGAHPDGHWYRVCISDIITENTVTVYFCDFGDVSVLSLEKLQPLKSEFLELPYQAIRARLVGIEPTNIDWSVEDCLRFQNLVVERDFVSIIVDITVDKHSPAETSLGLKLIGVDTEEDVYIDQLLVDEGRAVFTKS